MTKILRPKIFMLVFSTFLNSKSRFLIKCTFKYENVNMYVVTYVCNYGKVV